MDSTTAAESTTAPARTAPGYALLIGVSDYSAYDPSGHANLPGGQHDVALLFWFCRTILALPAENIRVLVSPTAPASSLVGASLPTADGSVLAATATNIREGITWLSDKLKESGAAGLLTYSGHGAWVAGKGSVICPADTTAELGNVISLAVLSASPELIAIRSALTVVLDCCLTVGSGRLAFAPDRRLVNGLGTFGAITKKTPGPADEELDLSECVYLATRVGQPAYQALFGGVFHGALTFALVASAEQWGSGGGHGESGLDVANKTVGRCTRALIKALRIEQRAKLRVPHRPKKRKEVRARRFFGKATTGTTALPDGATIPMQIDGGWKYTFNVAGSMPSIAYLIATGTSSSVITVGTNASYTGAAGKECWYVAPSNLASTNLAQTMTVARTTAVTGNESVSSTYKGYGGSATTSVPYILATEVASWTASTSSRPSKPTFIGTPYFYKYTPSSGAVIWVALDVSTSGSSYVLNQVAWYFISSSAPSGGTLNPDGAYAYQGQGASAAPSTSTPYFWALSRN